MTDNLIQFPGTTPVSSDFPQLDPHHLLDSFIEQEMRAGCQLSDEQALDFIAAANATLLREFGGKSEKKKKAFVKEYGEDVTGFVVYLRNAYFSRPGFTEKAANRWPNDPFIITIAEEWVDQMDDEEVLEVPSELKRQCDKLADYIFKLRADRTLMIVCSNGQNEVAHFPRTIPKHLLNSAKGAIRELLHEAAGSHGVVMLRYSSDIPGKEVLNGFSFTSGKAEKISVEDLRRAHETMPDGSKEPDPTTLYQEAFVSLD